MEKKSDSWTAVVAVIAMIAALAAATAYDILPTPTVRTIIPDPYQGIGKTICIVVAIVAFIAMFAIKIKTDAGKKPRFKKNVRIKNLSR
ncbi:MAG: hypothetical protein WCX97_01990 [Candidatus Magasanikbacteria bacterium]